MDAILTGKAEQLAREIASQATTLDELNGLLKLMMGSALERMLDTEMDVHLGRKQLPGSAGDSLVPGVADPFAEPPPKAACEESSQWSFRKDRAGRSRQDHDRDTA